MVRSIEVEDTSGRKKILSFYAIVMLLIYAGYVAMDYIRLSSGDEFGNFTDLSKAQLESVNKLGVLTIGFDVAFALLFLISSMVVVYLYHKNEDIALIRNFTVVNIVLFLVVALLGAGVSFILPTPMGNLLQIIVIPTYFLVALVLYILFATRLKGKNKTL